MTTNNHRRELIGVWLNLTSLLFFAVLHNEVTLYPYPLYPPGGTKMLRSYQGRPTCNKAQCRSPLFHGCILYASVESAT